VWGVIWLIIAFIFFMLGIFVGIIAFKVCLASRADVYTLYLQFWLWGLAHSRRMCLVGIDGPAGTRREALFARARVKQRDCVIAIDTACAITQHLIGYIARFALLAWRGAKWGFHARVRRACVVRYGG
jgi:hypothetical protein